MEDRDPKELLKKVIDGSASDQEKALLESWYFNWRKDDPAGLTEEDHEAAKAAIYSRLPQPEVKQRKLLPWQRIVAAAAVVSIVFGAWFFFASKGGRHAEFSAASPNYATDIAPGKQGASITLANGKVIQLSGAKSGVVIGEDLKYNDGAEIPDTTLKGRPQQLTASTARGQTYQFTLPDGTKVWLNADSKIRFPSYFAGSYRKILLSGEAYFEVAKDKKHPFIVNTNATANRARLDVEVLGTHFNISSYEDERLARTTLLEGEVAINGTYMKPGKQAVLMGKGLIISDVDAEAAVDWKNGLFMFDSESLESIMRKVSRWYNVNTVFADDQLKGLKFSGSVSRFDNVSELLDQLAHTHPVKFTIENHTITVKNK